MTHSYEEVIKLIERAGDNVEFADYGNGISDEWIEKAEKRLNIKFPNTYIWWLKNYGGGEVYGQKIFSIYSVDFDSVVGDDIVYQHELNRRNGNFDEN